MPVKPGLRVSVIGQGYVGLPLAIAASRAGHYVVGIEINKERLSKLKQGESPVEDIQDEVLRQSTLSTLTFQGDYSSIPTSDIVIICVPTPLDENQEPDLEPLTSCIREFSPLLKSGTLIVNESTSFPGTVRDLIFPLVTRLSGHKNHLFASAPERVDPGNLKWKISNTPRLIGGIDTDSQKFALDFYRSFCDSVLEVSSPEIAETAKLLENTFRQVNIALVSQLSEFARKLHIDIFEVIEAAATKPYGFMPFYPGAGVGGHCIPVDPMYLAWKARQLNAKLPLIELAQQINLARPKEIIKGIIERTKNRDDKVLVIGLGYKPLTSDVRESPGVKIYLGLKEIFKDVDWYDPFVEKFDGKCSSNNWGQYDSCVIVHDCGGLSIEDLNQFIPKIFDCSGRFANYDFIDQI